MVSFAGSGRGPKGRGFTVSSSAARTATHTSDDQNNRDHIGAYVVLDINEADSSCFLTVKIQAKSPGGTYFDLFTGSSFVPAETAAIKSYLVYPSGDTKVGGDVVGLAGVPLPSVWRVNVTHGNTRSADYSITAFVVPR